MVLRVLLSENLEYMRLIHGGWISGFGDYINEWRGQCSAFYTVRISEDAHTFIVMMYLSRVSQSFTGLCFYDLIEGDRGLAESLELLRLTYQVISNNRGLLVARRSALTPLGRSFYA